ncbi:MAG: hypothetical protein BWY86_00373 [Candidatus Aminicenantes bacterium ADurb.Bin508]|nr:MAG: hypothetical protein BWY86_00373 [Candidatus Aminicenantes bacterium ADurb.Bin508]
MLHIDKGGGSASLLRLRDDVKGQSRLSRGLLPVDLDNPPPGKASDAQGGIQAQGAGRDRLDIQDIGVSEAAQIALPKLPVDLGQGHLQGLVLSIGLFLDGRLFPLAYLFLNRDFFGGFLLFLHFSSL